MDIQLMGDYVTQLISDFVVPGTLGGFMVGFSVYLLSLGISYGYKLISSATEVEEIEY